MFYTERDTPRVRDRAPPLQLSHLVSYGKSVARRELKSVPLPPSQGFSPSILDWCLSFSFHQSTHGFSSDIRKMSYEN